MTEKTRILLVEKNHRTAATLSRHLWNADVVVDATSTIEGALMRLRHLDPNVIIAPSGPGQDHLCRQAKLVTPRAAVLLTFPPDETHSDKLAREAGADGYLVTPLDPGAVVNCARWALRLRHVAEQLDVLTANADRGAFERLSSDDDREALDLDFFKRVLQIELRRSKRYRWPLSLMMVGVDQPEVAFGKLLLHERSRQLNLLLGEIRKTLRDIDLAAVGGPEHFLVCLPQTDLDGGKYVAERLRERLGPAMARKGSPALTVSVGLAAYDGSGARPSLKALLDEAQAKLFNARKLGGNLVESAPVPLRR